MLGDRVEKDKKKKFPLPEAENLIYAHLNWLFSVDKLEYSDIGDLQDQGEVSSAYRVFHQSWVEDRHLNADQRSIVKSIKAVLGKIRYRFAIGLTIIATVGSFADPLILQELTKYQSGQRDLSTGGKWLLICSVLLIPLVNTLCRSHAESFFNFFSIQTRNALSAAIYHKTLVLSPTSKQRFTTAEISNLFVQDSQFIENFISFNMFNLISFTIQVPAALVLIYFQVGVSMFVGFGYIILLLPILAYLAYLLESGLSQYVANKDERLNAVNEALSAIRIIKYYGWEEAFVNSIFTLRDTEMRTLMRVANIWNVSQIVFFSISVVLPILVFYTYIRLGNTLDLTVAFTTLMLFAILQEPVMWLPSLVQAAGQALSACRRICTFLLAEEARDYITRKESLERERDDLDYKGGEIVVRISDCSLSWSREDGDDMCSDLEAVARCEGAEGVGGVGSSSSSVTDTSSGVTASKHVELTVLVPDRDGDDEVAVKSDDASLRQSEDKIVVLTSGVSRSVTENICDSNLMSEGSSTGKSRCALHDINISICGGKLVTVIGSVGCGKTTLLSALLGDLSLVAGTIEMKKGIKIAYHQQSPWILNRTIQENIVMDEKVDEAKLQAVLQACALQADLDSLAAGIHTEIGEKGINLSGGQKARVSLARSLYRSADIYLLDDPLSAVDAHVSGILFYQGIKRLLAGKTVLLVTHQVQYLSDSDHIVVLEAGRVAHQGTYEELSLRGVDFSVLTQSEGDTDPQLERSQSQESNSGRSQARSGTNDSDKNRTRTGTGSSSIKKTEVELKEVESATSHTVLMAEDERSAGKVSWSTYSMYLRAGGYPLYLLVVLCAAGTCATSVWGDYYLSHWGEKAGGGNFSDSDNVDYLTGYAWRKSIGIVTTGLVYFFGVIHSFSAGSKIHYMLLTVLMGATVSYFDTTPQGRIFSRFSNYMNDVDSGIVIGTLMVITASASLLGAVVAIAYSTRGLFVVLVIPMGFIYYQIYSLYSKTNTDVVRLRNMAMGPVQIEFQQAVYGVKSIRAFCFQDAFVKRMTDSLNRQSACLLLTKSLNCWLKIRLDALGACTVFFVYVLSFSVESLVSSGDFVVAVLMATSLPRILSMFVAILTQVEASYTSLEKIQKDIDSAAQEETQEQRVSGGMIPGLIHWPKSGSVTFTNVEMGYRILPSVLLDVCLDIQSGQKVGICGRTGCGKSSLMVALFRIENLRRGSILIDGIDISHIPLHVLRSRIVIIPQDPVMFANTVRFNVDPLSLYTDDEVWEALQCVNLKQAVADLPEKLSEKVQEGGQNFSSGQKQLFCFARAILRKPLLIVLDEATASVDNATDLMIQNMIKDKFRHCTILTIAHRLNTIIDYDRIAVIDQGVVVEYGTPQELIALKREGQRGLFADLWKNFQASHT